MNNNTFSFNNENLSNTVCNNKMAVIRGPLLAATFIVLNIYINYLLTRRRDKPDPEEAQPVCGALSLVK